MSRVPAFLASPIQIAATAKHDRQRVLRVVVETPRGGRNKMSYDEDLGIFRLKKDEKFRVTDLRGPGKAWKRIERAMRAFAKES